jgi:sugar-specific transcriptional regulator TrmB
MLTTLINLGFTESEVQVYVFLATEGPKKARDIADTLKIQKNQLYCILKKLRSQGIVNPSSEYPARFSAVSFDQILDIIIKARAEQQEVLEASKQELISAWRSIIKKDSADNS